MSDRLHKIRINEAINQIRSLLTVKKPDKSMNK